jgi:hypothetical protein
MMGNHGLKGGMLIRYVRTGRLHMIIHISDRYCDQHLGGVGLEECQSECSGVSAMVMFEDGIIKTGECVGCTRDYSTDV